MHERERHRIILSAVQARPVATVQEFSELTGASEATIRRDIAQLHVQKKLKKVRGGAEAISASPFGVSLGPSFDASQLKRSAEKRAIAVEAVKLCAEGDAVIINGGTTTFQMVHKLVGLRLQVLTNSFPIAAHLVKHSKCTVLMPAGAIFREQGLILSPFIDDGIAHFRARRMFMGAQGVSAYGIAEADPLLIQSEQRLMRQADELVLMVDSSKFSGRSSLLVAPLERAHSIITDDGITDGDAAMIEALGVRLIVAGPERAETGDMADVA